MADQNTTTTAPRAEQANLFELSSNRVRVTFSASSFAGVPQLSYRDRNMARLFQGEEIQFEETALGTLVTVVLEAIPDFRTITFTLVIPEVRVIPGMTARVRLPGIQATREETLLGPGLGQQKVYRTSDLTGTAQFVLF
jgi:hypothetical protein